MSQAEFAEFDYRLMAMAFAIHNEFGRFCHESVYQAAFLDACRDAKLSAETEVRISVSHGAFCKHYFVDLVVAEGALYELKTVERFAPEHRAQILTYIMLLGLNHGKLINWRMPSVQSEFVSTSLTPKTRREFEIDTGRWDASHPSASSVLETTRALMADWGAFLNIEIYRDAIIELVTGNPAQADRVDIAHGSRIVGHQPLHLVTPETALVVSASTAPTGFEKHLERLLNHTTLDSMLWINLNQHDIACTTLNNKGT